MKMLGRCCRSKHFSIAAVLEVVRAMIGGRDKLTGRNWSVFRLDHVSPNGKKAYGWQGWAPSQLLNSQFSLCYTNVPLGSNIATPAA